MKHLHLILISISILLTSCATQNKGIFTIEEKRTQFDSGNRGVRGNLAKHIHENVNLSIIVAEMRNQYQRGYEDLSFMKELYGTIEKEFSSAGYIVKDRQIYNKVAKSSLDKYGIKELDDVDIVFEIYNLVPNVVFNTDEYVSKKSQEKIKLQQGKFTIYGAGMEITLRMADSGDAAGDFEYSVIPCLEGCEYNIGEDEFIYRDKDTKRSEFTVNGVIQKDVLLKFVRESTRDLITYLKKVAAEKPKKKSWGLIKSSNEIHEITEGENGKIMIIQNGASQIIERDEVSQVEIQYTENGMQILELENNTPLLTLEKGDKVFLKGAEHKLPYFFQWMDKYNFIHFNCSEGYIGNTAFMSTGKGARLTLDALIPSIKKVEKRGYLKRLKQFPYGDKIQWRDSNSDIQSFQIAGVFMQTDSILTYNFSDNGNRVYKNIVPESLDLIDNHLSHRQDTIQTILDGWSVPLGMFDLGNSKQGKFLPSVGDTVTFVHLKSISFISFNDKEVHMVKQRQSYDNETKIGYKGEWNLNKNILQMKLEGTGKYIDKKELKEVKINRKLNLELKIISYSKDEFAFEVISVQSEIIE